MSVFKAEDAVLLLQPDRALPPDRLHGHPRLHPAAGLGGEARARWGKDDIWEESWKPS